MGQRSNDHCCIPCIYWCLQILVSQFKNLLISSTLSSSTKYSKQFQTWQCQNYSVLCFLQYQMVLWAQLCSTCYSTRCVNHFNSWCWWSLLPDNDLWCPRTQFLIIPCSHCVTEFFRWKPKHACEDFPKHCTKTYMTQYSFWIRPPGKTVRLGFPAWPDHVSSACSVQTNTHHQTTTSSNLWMLECVKFVKCYAI